MIYTVKPGESIIDVILNSTGDLSNWDSILYANGFDDWVPILNPGNQVIISDEAIKNDIVLAQLGTYPSSNNFIKNWLSVINQVFTDIANNTFFVSWDWTNNVSQSVNNKIYKVRPGESIADVVLNATGSLSNWDLILQANNFTDWVPSLIAGQSIIIPDNCFFDLNTIRELTLYPSCNNFIDQWVSDLNNIFNIFIDNWILKTNFWRDAGIWIDTETWKD